MVQKNGDAVGVAINPSARLAPFYRGRNRTDSGRTLSSRLAPG